MVLKKGVDLKAAAIIALEAGSRREGTSDGAGIATCRLSGLF
jgi:hypothetical protein